MSRRTPRLTGPIPVTITREPDPAWQRAFGRYLVEEAQKRGIDVSPLTASVREDEPESANSAAD